MKVNTDGRMWSRQWAVRTLMETDGTLLLFWLSPRSFFFFRGSDLLFPLTAAFCGGGESRLKTSSILLQILWVNFYKKISFYKKYTFHSKYLKKLCLCVSENMHPTWLAKLLLFIFIYLSQKSCHCRQRTLEKWHESSTRFWACACVRMCVNAVCQLQKATCLPYTPHHW